MARCLWAVAWQDVSAESYADSVAAASEPGALILLEKYARGSDAAACLLDSVADIVSRGVFIEEYVLTRFSVTSGIPPDEVIARLDALAHGGLDGRVAAYVRSIASRVGRASLIWRGGSYWLCSPQRMTLDQLAADDEIRALLAGSVQLTSQCAEQQLKEEATAALVRTRAKRLGVELSTYYEYREDSELQPLVSTRGDGQSEPLTLRSSVSLRPYQEEALYRMCCSGGAQSGVVVLPCGAGKTLLGIAAAVTVGRPVVIMCTGSAAAWQWLDEWKACTNITELDLMLFTGDSTAQSRLRAALETPWLRDRWRAGTQRGRIRAPGVVITTYAMMSQADSAEGGVSQVVRSWVREQAWGVCILDEVHAAAAPTFRLVCSTLRARCFFGLTATLVREDQGIADVHELVGPRLLEANWLQLCSDGFLARPLVREIRCRGPGSRDALKIDVCRELVAYHRAAGDHVLVFGDRLATLTRACELLGISSVTGNTEERLRRALFDEFRNARSGAVLGVSRVADTSINLPEATVVVQIGFMGGSRRQEVQRLGRLLRPKPVHEGGNVVFYTLVAGGAREEAFQQRRRAYLISQGFTVTVSTSDALLAEIRARRDAAET